MQVCSRLAQLPHISQHQPGLTLRLSQHVQRHLQRLRVGVVGIVDQDNTARQLVDIETPCNRLQGFQPGPDGIQTGARRLRHGSRGQRVHNIVPAR